MSDENLGFLFVATTKRLPFMLLFTTKLVIVLKFAVHAFRIHLQSKPKGGKKKQRQKNTSTRGFQKKLLPQSG